MNLRLSSIALTFLLAVILPLPFASFPLSASSQFATLVAHWTFDNDATDVTGNGHQGVVNGAVPAEGRFGGSLAFDGVDDHVRIPGAPLLSTVTASAHSMAAWVFLAEDTQGAFKFIIDAAEPSAGGILGDQRGLRLDDGYVVFKWVTTSGSHHAFSNAPLEPGEWHHLVGTFDGIQGALYVNGVLHDTQDSTGTPNEARIWNIGDISAGGTGTGHFPGRIDDVRVYSAALTPQEVVRLYSDDSTPPLVTCDAPPQSWSADDVVINCTAEDAESWLADPDDASFQLSTSVPDGHETANATTGSRTICDAAGNCTFIESISGLKVDKKAPTITISVPAASPLIVGAAVAAQFTCSDWGSGVASCQGTVPNGAPLATSSPGTSSFTVEAVDGVGNTSYKTVEYITTYATCALFDQARTWPGGAVPVHLRLCTANGVNASTPNVGVQAVRLTRGGSQWAVMDAGNANPQNNFRFTDGAYMFNLSTEHLSTGTYELHFVADGDPITHSVLIRID